MGEGRRCLDSLAPPQVLDAVPSSPFSDPVELAPLFDEIALSFASIYKN